MRYQSRPIRSQSYLNNNKQNKQNQNILNEKPVKPLKPQSTLVQVKKRELIKKPIDAQHLPFNSIKPLLKDQPTPIDLKKQYSQQTGQQYSREIINHLCQQSHTQKNFLQNHDITPHLRSKMVDWMIEVLSSYKMNQDTFFRALKIMDTFLLQTQKKQQIKDLHLIGVASMWSGCKYEEIYPIKLQTMYDKIARKKFTRNEILGKQSQILASLNFRLQQPNIYDIVKHLSFELNLNLTTDKQEYLEQIILYLAKMSLFSYQLAQQETKLLAAAVYFIALKTLEQVETSLKPEEKLCDVAMILETEEQKIIEVSRKVLDLAKNFSIVYPSLGNLKKFNKFEYKKKSTARIA